MVVGATFAWRSWGDEAEEMIKRRTSSMGWVSRGDEFAAGNRSDIRIS